MGIKAFLGNIVSRSIKKKLDSWTITEEDIQDTLKQIRIALLDADVNLLVVKNLIKNIKEKAIGYVMEKNQQANQVLLTIVKQELINVLGKEVSEFGLNKPKFKAMFVGLQGSGKTTSIAKVAYYLKNKKNKQVLLVAADVYRPAAIDQLVQLAKKIDVECFHKKNASAQDIVIQANDYAQEHNFDVVLVDTAGRLQTNEELMNELKQIKKIISPNEIVFVADAMAGQDIVNVAQEFNQWLNLTAFIISKMDSDARAGATLSLISLLNLPIKFIGTGEQPTNLDVFHPDRIADQILGLGDIMTLAEKASEVVDQDKTKKSFARMLSGKFDLEDLMVQMEQINRFGSFNKLVEMMPGEISQRVSSEQVDSAQQKMMIWKVMMSSMTKLERRNPKLLKKEPSRKTRIVHGSGRKPDELNKMLSEWEKAKTQMDELGKQIRSGKNPFSQFFNKK